MYADDLKIFFKIRTLNDCYALQRDLNRLSKFCEENDLFLNMAKCNSVSFSRNHQIISFDYKINNVALQKVNQVKDLGVIFDSKLSFNAHVEKVVNACNRMLGYIMRQCQHFKNQKSLIVLYNAYIFSKLNFATVIWNPQYSVYIDRLEKIQYRFVKYLGFKTFTPVNTITYEINRKSFGFLSLESRRKLNDVLFLYKIANNIIDSEHILQSITFNIPQKKTRLKNLFSIPFKNTNSGQNSPLCRMFQVCNFLNTEIDFDIFYQSLNLIKNRVKNYLLQM